MFFRRPRFRPQKKKSATTAKPRPLTNKQRQQFAREHYQLHHGTGVIQTPSNTTRSKTTTITTSPISPMWSPDILGHRQPTQQQPHSPSFTTPITTPKAPTTDTPDTPTLSAAWSPKILGYHLPQSEKNHTMDSEQTIPFTPTNMHQFLSYIDYIGEIREHGNPIFNLSLHDQSTWYLSRTWTQPHTKITKMIKNFKFI